MITIEWSEENNCYIGRNSEYPSAVIPSHDAGECLLSMIMISNKLDIAAEESRIQLDAALDDLEAHIEELKLTGKI